MKLTIGDVQLEDVQVEEALVLLGRMEGKTKIKRSYVGVSKDSWSKEEVELLKEKISQNYSKREIIDKNFLPGRSETAVAYKFYQTRKRMMRGGKYVPVAINRPPEF